MVTCHEEGEAVVSSSTGGGVTTGGGFSNAFAQPWYQKEAAAGYLTQQDSPVPDVNAWSYNTAGRAYPDISAAASNYLVWMGDHLQPTSGTSASTPLIAAMVAHLNEQRLRRNMPPLGFLNPLLYTLGSLHPEAFNDVVVGDNKCGIKPEPCCEIGFGAARGWDAVTGWGSPKLNVLLDLLRPGQGGGGVSLMGLPADAESQPASPFWVGVLSSATGLALGVFTLGAFYRKRRASKPSGLQAGLLS